MKRIMFLSVIAALAMSLTATEARVVNSRCSGDIRSTAGHACTVLLMGPVTGTATVQPDEDGHAEVKLVILADPRDAEGNPISEPMILAECEAVSEDGPATCTAEWHGALASLPTPSIVNQSNGQSLPGRCIGTGSGDGTFSCSGGSV